MGGGRSRRRIQQILVQPNPAEQSAAAATSQQSELSRQLFEQAGPLRQFLFAGGAPSAGLLGRILQPISREPLPIRPVSPIARETAERQFDVAKENILQAVPRGGVQRRLLGDIEIGRAGELARQSAEIEQQNFESMVADLLRGEEAEQITAGRAIQTAGPALGQTQLAIGGLGQSAGILSNLAGIQSQRQLGAAGFESQSRAQTLGLIGQLAQGLGQAIGGSRGGSKKGK